MSQEQLSPSDAIQQLANGLLALTHAMAATNPDHTMARLAAAIYASREQGIGDGILMEAYQRAFPGKALPTPATDEQIAEIIKRNQSGSS